MTHLPVPFPQDALPDHWRLVRMRFLATYLSRGGTPKYSDQPSGLAVVNQACIHWDGFRPENLKHHESVADPNSMKGYLQNGDLVVNSTGEGTVGRSLVFHEGDGYVTDGHVTIIRFDPEEMDPYFVALVLNTSTFQAYMDAWFILGATKQVELTAGRLRNAFLPVPPIEEQHRIVKFLAQKENRLRELEGLVATMGVFKVGREGLLAERHDALVTAAVTGKLDPQVGVIP